MKAIHGRVWCFGDDVNTDVIHPPPFFSLDPARVKAGLFHGLDPTLQPRLRAGDVFVGGRNFGCGSSRETSIRSLLLNQVGAIIAVDFARIFFRNATNSGLPCFTLRDADDQHRLRPGARVEVNVAEALVRSEDGTVIALEPPGYFVMQIWEAGGLLAMLPRALPTALAGAAGATGGDPCGG